MKKLMITALMLIGIGISASAQNWGLGVNLGYGNDVSKPSFGIKALYDINEEFTLAPSLNFYLPETESASSGGASLEAELKCWDINADVHWNFYNTNKGKLYPLAGVSYFNAKISAKASAGGQKESASKSEGKFGINLGFGGQMNLSEKWVASAEIKYQIIEEFKQFVPSLSLIYKF